MIIISISIDALMKKLNSPGKRSYQIGTYFNKADEDQQVTRTTLTRERWLLPLFQELGYGRLQQANIRQLNNREYPISHEWNGLPYTFLEQGGPDRRILG